jgi:hypothetical protein
MALPDDNDENDEERKEPEGTIHDKLDETNDIELLMVMLHLHHHSAIFDLWLHITCVMMMMSQHG